MQQAVPRSRPVWVTALGILSIVGGAFLALMGVILALVGAAAGAAGAVAGAVGVAGDFGPLAGAFGAGAFFLLLWAAVSIVVGIGLLKGRRWARILALVSLWVGGIINAVSFLAGLGGGNFGLAVGPLVFAGLAALFLIKLYGAPVRAYFGVGVKAAPPPAAPA